ncbi:hypothetical protein OF83DRAFT_48246 [Amylostereum chailletii]|nr:hypothetical protein OF83DRAFT_48246 [Amylostereum chailletii]
MGFWSCAGKHVGLTVGTRAPGTLIVLARTPSPTLLHPLTLIPMYTADPATTAYAASVNPPRRAKRPRPRSSSPGKTRTRLPSIAPALANRPSSPYDSPQPNSNEEDEDPVPQPKRRGRKPSTLSRAARDSMRRQNHSRIEKARRTKINDALATLRQLVPTNTRLALQGYSDQEAEEEDDDDFEVEKKGCKKPRQEKEFKLEILEKTVVYVQELQERIRSLETRSCAQCPGQTRAAPRRPDRSQKRQRVEEAEEPDLSEDDLGSYTSSPKPDPRKVTTAPTKQAVSMTPTTSSTRLPSISSWLPQASAEPGFPSERTTMRSFSHRRPSCSAPTQLLTPPTSTTLRQTPSLQIPPILSLDLPPPNPHAQSFTQGRTMSTSNPWTPEDESAASLLLQIRTSSSSSPGEITRAVRETVRVQTPATLLGMKLKAG